MADLRVLFSMFNRVQHGGLGFSHRGLEEDWLWRKATCMHICAALHGSARIPLNGSLGFWVANRLGL
jgi:hypothetical protein